MNLSYSSTRARAKLAREQIGPRCDIASAPDGDASGREIVSRARAWSHRTKSPTDPQLLERLLAIHHARGGKSADMSGGLRRLWTPALLRQYRPVFVDIDPAKEPDIVGDSSRQHEFLDPHSLATEVWDPPQVTGAGATGLIGGRIGGWGERYGTRGPDLEAPTAIIDLFGPFLDSAWGSLEPGRGTLIVKMADQVRAQVLRFQPYWLWLIALSRGWHACDWYVRGRAQPRHNTTIVQEHVRRAATHWLVFHNFEGCPGSGIEVQRRCPGCHQLFPVTRADRLVCGERCRQRLSRFERKQLSVKRDTARSVNP